MSLEPDLNGLYSKLMNEEDARVCKDIPDGACTNVPQNFFRQVLANTLTSLGDTLTNPKTTLAWLMGVVGAPVALVAWLVPIRESGSMLPQLLIASYVRRFKYRNCLLSTSDPADQLPLSAPGGRTLPKNTNPESRHPST